MFQMAELAGKLRSLLDGPSVCHAVGQKAISIISNMMEGDSVALSACANRYPSCNLQTSRHTLPHNIQCF